MQIPVPVISIPAILQNLLFPVPAHSLPVNLLKAVLVLHANSSTCSFSVLAKSVPAMLMYMQIPVLAILYLLIPVPANSSTCKFSRPFLLLAYCDLTWEKPQGFETDIFDFGPGHVLFRSD